MAVMNKEDIIDSAREILDIDLNDSSKTGLLEFYYESGVDDILDLCQVSEVPTSLNTTLVNMIVFLYRKRGIENVQSEGKGSLSQSYIVDYPPIIMNKLYRNSKVRFQ